MKSSLFNLLMGVLLCVAVPAVRGGVQGSGSGSVADGRAAALGEKVHLSVWYLPGADDTGIKARCHREVVAAFRRRYPHIVLTSPTGLQIPEMSAMDTGPLMAIAGGVSPDVIYVNFRQSSTYIKEGFLYPLDEWIGKLDPAELAERILPQVGPVVHRRGPAGGGEGGKHYWALPYGLYVKGLCWRKDLFQQAGLDPERPPRTWSELHEFARRCTDPAKGTYGLAWSRSPHWSAYFYSFLCSAGARAIEERGEDQWVAAFDSQEAVTAYEFVVKLLAEPWRHESGAMVEGVVCRDAAAPLLWAQGRVAMVERYLTDDLLADINPDLVGVAPVPAGPGGRSVSELNCAMCGIFSGAAGKGRAVLDAAWEYVHFLGSREAKELTTRVLVENGYGLFANPELLERLGYVEYARRIPIAWRTAYRQAVADGEPEPYGQNCQMIYNYMSAPADRMLAEGLGGNPDQRAVRGRIEAILAESVRAANAKMGGTGLTGAVGPRRFAATVAVLCVLAAFVWMWISVSRTFRQVGRVGPARAGGAVWTAWVMLAPALLLMAVWRYLPMLWGGCMAFQDYHLMLPGQWTGIDNFALVLWDPEFWRALGASVWYTLLSLAMGFVLPIGLAVLLHELPRGKVFYRVVYYLPAVVSGLVVMLMWKSFFDSSPRGLLNQLIAALGLPFGPIKWLDDPVWAMPCVVLPTVWAGLGPGCLVYLAALKTVPDELYDAADLDGAGFFAKLYWVTIPSIRVLVYINFVGAVINAFRVSEYILAMTGGGPAGATQVLALKIFYDAFVYLRFGMATASAWVLGSLLVGFTLMQIKRLARVEYRTV